MRFRATVLGVGVALFSACASAAVGAGGQEPKALGAPFVLREGQSTVVGPDKVTVTFEKLLSESRCPVDVQCIQAGEASILLQVQPAGGAKTPLTLSTRPDADVESAGDVTVTLTDLRPVPRVKAPAKREPYRATLLVTPRN